MSFASASLLLPQPPQLVSPKTANAITAMRAEIFFIVFFILVIVFN
jgi:hypothetical protein